MKPPKKEPSQLEFPFPHKVKPTHGGKRKGAGRKNTTGKRSHTKRELLRSGYPVHVTLRLASGFPSLRRKDLFKCLREAVKTARKRGFAVAHFALLSNHVHLILEPREKSLRGVFQSFGISLARRIHSLLGTKGAIFHDRYHVHVLKTPTETRRALSYVLTNEAWHRQKEVGASRGKLQVALDPFSSAFAFDDWRTLLGAKVEFRFTRWSDALIESWYSEILTPARSWLLCEGWKKAPSLA